MSSLPAGWYTDPADPATQRYWDGEGWLGKAIPADATPPEGPPPPEPDPPAPVTPTPATAPGGSKPGASANEAPKFPETWTPPPGYPPPPPGWLPPPGWTPPAGWLVQARPHGLALAGMGARLAARLFDVAAVLLLNVVVNGYFAWQFWLEFAPTYRQAMADPFGDQPTPTARSEYLIWTMLIIATLLWLLYEAPAIGSRGQTLGKRLLRIKVMAVETTEPIGFGRAFRRWARLGLWTPFWGCAGLGFLLQLMDSLSPLFDRKLRQALHDKTARTVVVALPHDHHQTVSATPGGGSSEGSAP